ncbi:MAG: hypothetical protein IRZ28_10265 [Steroidobacteraceae bacterium]|nr:hypothetical protein [Steroidobacteraceae bacterium]
MQSMRPALFGLGTVLTLCFAVSGCATNRAPFVVALPNGYYLQRDKAHQPQIVKRSGGTVLPGPVAAYAVYRELVTGCVCTWPKRAFAYPNESPFPGSPDARYFVLDTTNGRLEKDLDEATWRARLEALGAPKSLQITAPVLPE